MKLTDHQKQEIVKKYKLGNTSVRELAASYNASKSAISRIVNCSKPNTVVSSSNNSNLDDGTDEEQKITEKTKQFRKLDEVTFLTFLKMREQNFCINSTIIKTIGVCAANEIGFDGFKASNGWVERFIKRHSLEFKSISGESKSVDESKIGEFYEKLQEKLKEYKPENVFNCDETGVQYLNMPSKTYVEQNDSCKGVKQRKDRITILFCCSLAGEKIAPLVIGKSKNPRSLKNFDFKKVQVDYVNSKNAWMNSEIFKNWILKLENEMVRQKRKILMLLDNAPCHNVPLCTSIEFLFLPKNTTALIQPLDSGVMKSFKNHYSNVLVESFIFNKQLISNGWIKDITIKDVIIFISIAWDRIKSDVIINCFEKAFESAKNCLIKEDENVNQDVVNNLVLETVEEINSENDAFSEEENEPVEFDYKNEIKEALKNLDLLSKSAKLLGGDSLKTFYEFRIEFIKNLKKNYGWGKDVTDYFK